jgi:hypothetical protein
MTSKGSEATRAAAARAMRHFDNYGYGMLAALFLFGVAQLSLSIQEPWDTAARAVLTLAIYIVGLLSVASTRLRFIIGATLCAAALVDEALGFLLTGGLSSISGAELSLILIAFLIYCLTVDLLTRRGALRTQLLASVCLYVLLAILFSRLYMLIDESFDGKAFAGSFTGSGADRFSRDDALYFSFVTQTTVGFGDIYPIVRPARAVTVIHATIGVLYIAVVVSSITSARQENRPKE